MATYITLDESKRHLRVDFTDDDIYIQGLIDLVEEYVINDIQGEAAHKSTGTITTAISTALTGTGTNFTDFKVGDIIKVEGDYSRIIASITDDTTGTVTAAFTGVLTDVDYRAYTGLPQVMSDGTLPLGIKHAMLIMLGHFYMIREPVVMGINATEVPFSYKSLIAPWKNYTVG